MKTMKKLLAAVLATVMLLGVTACGNKNDTPAADGDNTGTTSTTVLKMGHVYSETYPMHLAMLAMADEVYEKTEGRYKIEIYANSSLGNESDLNEGVNIGTVDMAFTATTPLANIVPDLACLDLPYLIQDSAHADAVFFDKSSPIRAALINSIDSAGFKTLALVENGFRQLYTNKKVASTADLKGLKIRVMENPLHLELWNALGASPTAMAASEAMTGLQQGTIDAVEMFHTAYATSGFAELCKYYVNTNHIYTCGALLLSAKVWNGMSEADQKVFTDAAATMAATTNSQLRDMDESSREKIVNELVEEAFDLDKTELRAMVQPVYDAHPEYSDFVAQVDALAK